MTRPLSLFLLCLAVLSFPGVAEAWEWPTDEPRVLSFFGTVEEELYPGIRLAGDSVVAVADGRVLAIQASAGDTVHIIVDHGAGLSVMYEDIARESLDLSVGNLVLSREQLGRSAAGQFGVRVYDTQLRRVLNPLIILPDLRDPFRPIIDGIRLSGVEWDGGVLEAGTYDLEILAYDRISITQVMQLYGLEIYLNGQELLNMRLDALVSDGSGYRPLSSPDLDLEELIREPGIFRVPALSLGPGEVLIDVVAYDRLGNRATARFGLSIIAPQDDSAPGAGS